MDNALKFNDKAIQQLFFQYIESCQDKERHSAEAVRCAEVFDDFCSRHIEGDMLKKIEAYTKMTDVAVEFEEDGFIAGFKMAMNLLLAQEPNLSDDTQNTTDEARESRHEATSGSNEGSKMKCFNTSLQIAELFQTPNHKEVTFYKLNQAACMMYLEIMEPKKTQFINIAGGYAKLQELMQSTFRTEAVPLPA